MKSVIVFVITTMVLQLHALSAHPLAQITFHVTDDEGAAVTNAKVHILSPFILPSSICDIMLRA